MYTQKWISCDVVMACNYFVDLSLKGEGECHPWQLITVELRVSINSTFSDLIGRDC
jgi:hypothetical protein